MTSNTAKTSGNFRTLSLTDQLVSVKLIKDPIELGYALRRIYSNYVYEFDEECAKQKKRRHMDEIKEAGNDYEIYNKLTDVFSAWADAAGKSMPRWEEYDKVIRKRYGSNIDTEYDLFDVIRNKWKMQWKMPTPEEEKNEWKEKPHQRN